MDEKEKRKGLDMLYAVLGSLLAALVLTGLSLLIISVIYLSKDLSDETARSLVTAAALVSVFVSALISGKKMKSRGLLTGSLVGAAYSLCLYITGVLAFGIMHFSKSFFGIPALSVFIGALGGIAGVNLKGKK